jgi:predicted nucleic acid-binding protein
MARTLTFLDTGVLLIAYKTGAPHSDTALRLFENPARQLELSPLVRLETIPQAAYHKQREEIEFYEACFRCVSIWIDIEPKLIREAERFASRYGLHAMDSLHVAAAVQAGAQEFITTERNTKPLYRVTELRVVRLDSLT